MMRQHGNREVEYEDEYAEYEDYEEEASEPDEEELEAPKVTKEEQDFLKLREQFKERARKNLKEQIACDFGHSSQSQDRNRSIKRDTFGSFFGPSQPVIAARVLEESRSIHENKHLFANVSANKNESTSSAKTNVHHHTNIHQRPKVVNEMKKKAQTLKDMRDYSFLHSDDADFPTPVKEEPVKRSVSVPIPDRRLAQEHLKSKGSAKPTRVVSSGTDLKSSSTKVVENKPRVIKDAPTNRAVPPSNEYRKVSDSSVGTGPAKSAANNAALKKDPARTMNGDKPLNNFNNPSLNEDILSAKIKSSVPPQYSEHKRPNQAPAQARPTMKQPLPSSKPKVSRPTMKKPLPSKPQQNSSRAIPDERPKKRPPKRNLGDEEADYRDSRPKKRPPPRNVVDYSSLIRKMFRYNPNKYAGMDEDDSDMVVGFDSIQKEERRSSMIARKEDEEQLCLIEEEEERERRRKMMKKKLK